MTPHAIEPDTTRHEGTASISESAATLAPPTGDAAAAIELIDVVHRYPPLRAKRSRAEAPATTGTARDLALDHLSLTIPQGGIFALLGPNGGGKSTLFKIIATILRQTSGTVRVLGEDVLTQSHRVRSHLGVLFQMPSLDVQLTARENLRHEGHMHGLWGATLHKRIDHWLEQLGLAPNRDDRVLAFSGGMRRRLELAKALLHHPRILLLDEPATGLDPAARRDVWQHLVNLKNQGVTVALTTHMMDEADRSTRVAIINHGRLVAMDTPARLKASIGGDVITIHPAVADDVQNIQALLGRVTQLLAGLPQVTQRVVEGKIYVECPDGPSMVARLGGALAGQVQSISVGQPTLEDVFMNLTGQSMKRSTPS